MKRQLLPPAWFGLAVAAMVILHLLLPVCRIVSRPWSLLGIAPVLSGIALNLWADRQFKHARTTVKPFEESRCLITTGPFRISRHPMYLGMTALLAGLAVLLGTLTSMIVIPLFVLLMAVRFIPVEERMMEETFGDAYRSYRKRVRSWL
jgi:protein-S-isoprenylcysteine O-methyltransferase Ste14